VRKIDQVDDAVHHGVAEGQQRIHAAEYQPIDDLLQQDVDGGFPKGARL